MRCERSRARSATITLNRPDKLNAFTVEMVRELSDALTMLGRAEAVRAIVLTGAGRAFCAGADVGLLRELIERQDEPRGRALVDGMRQVAHAIREAPQPVLCSVNGVAAGGGANLVLACDLRIAADTAQIGQVFMKIGLHPDWGGAYFLPRLVGASKALELFIGAEMVGAAEALRLGLVNRVAPARAAGGGDAGVGAADRRRTPARRAAGQARRLPERARHAGGDAGLRAGRAAGVLPQRGRQGRPGGVLREAFPPLHRSLRVSRC